MQDDFGYVYTAPDGSLNYVALEPGLVLRGLTVSVSTNATPPIATGHEAAGPQPTDAKATADAMGDVLRGWAESLFREEKGRDVANAVTALHRQHTRDGRPARFIPETE